jgi:tRNA pseudouridine55 synthase
MHGALLVDKPKGPTSHDVVAFARRALTTRAIGHTGTLDPLATGLLVLLIGHATRLSRFLVTDEKEYIADVRLGIATATYDAQGLDLEPSAAPDRGPTTVDPASIAPDRIRAVLGDFVGTFPQMPPAFSAKKVDGVRAYQKARKREPVDLKPVEVTVRELDVVSDDVGISAPGPRAPDPTLLRLRIVCGAGFYVRSLAHDIGQLLGCGAHLEALRRTRAGQFSVADALSLEGLERAGDTIGGRLLDPNILLAAMPAVTPTEEGQRRAWNGNTLAPAHLQARVPGPPGGAKVRVLSPSGAVLAVAERRADGLLHPLVVLR